MKNNILSKLSFVFVAVFCFMTLANLVAAEEITRYISSTSEFTNAYNTAEYSSAQNVTWEIQSDITVSINPHFTRQGLNLVINGNGHKITFTKSGGDAIGYALSFNNRVDDSITINDLTIIVGDGYRSGVFVTGVPATLNNVNITMAQENQPVISNKLKFGCPLVVNYAHVTLKGNNAFEANQWSWSAVDLTSNIDSNAVLEIQNDATLNITDNRTAERKAIDPVLKATIKNSSKTCQVINPERANLVKGEDKLEDGNQVFAYYLRLDEVRITMPEIKVGNVIPTTIAVAGTPTGALKANTVPFTCYVSNTSKEAAPTDEEVATGIFEDGKYYYCTPNFDEVIDGSYLVGDFTKVYVNGEEVDQDYFNKWIKTAYTYEVKEADKLSFDKGKIETLVLTVDGDYSLFESLKVGDLTLEKDTDYKVTAGSTVITFTEEGLAKLNKLAKGNYDVEVKYTNGKTVTTTLTIDEIVNPKTGVSVPYIVLGVVVLIGIISLIVVKKKYNN